jgi:hypothetical protein
MKFEPVTKKQVAALIKAVGFGAIVIDWNDIDYDLGRGIKKDGHCLFLTNGRRIDIGGYEYGLILSQTKEPDPLYETYKKEARP